MSNGVWIRSRMSFAGIIKNQCMGLFFFGMKSQWHEDSKLPEIIVLAKKSPNCVQNVVFQVLWKIKACHVLIFWIMLQKHKILKWTDMIFFVRNFVLTFFLAKNGLIFLLQKLLFRVLWVRKNLNLGMKLQWHKDLILTYTIFWE